MFGVVRVRAEAEKSSRRRFRFLRWDGERGAAGLDEEVVEVVESGEWEMCMLEAC